MKGSDLPRSWREYLDDIDKILTKKGTPPSVCNGIARDVEEHLIRWNLDGFKDINSR